MFGFLGSGPGRTYQAPASHAPARTRLSQAYYGPKAPDCFAGPQLSHDTDTGGVLPVLPQRTGGLAFAAREKGEPLEQVHVLLIF